MSADIRTCKNGHTAEYVVRSDGYKHCPVCKKESSARRNRRYQEANRELLNAKRRDRDYAAREARRLEAEAEVLADVAAMRERVAARRRKREALAAVGR